MERGMAIPMDKVKKTTDKRKKRALIFAASTIALAVVCGASIYILNRKSEKDGNAPTSMYSDKINSYIFYTPDYDLDVTSVEEYMEMDRIIYYKDGAEEYAVSENAASIGDAALFFEKYFETAIAGKWEEYNEMFTEKYYETNEPRIQFAPQMIYDMHVEKLWEKIDESDKRYAFNVSYRIYRNDGTFRNDIESGASKTLYFELAYENGELKIDRITYYV